MTAWRSFYLAGSFERLEEIRVCAEELRALNYIVDCRWLEGLHQVHPGAKKVESAIVTMPPEARLFAQDDVEDLSRADAIVCFTEPPYSYRGRGGRHVELGMAIAWKKPVFIVGPRENVFCCLPGIEAFDSWKDFLKFLEIFNY